MNVVEAQIDLASVILIFSQLDKLFAVDLLGWQMGRFALITLPSTGGEAARTNGDVINKNTLALLHLRCFAVIPTANGLVLNTV